jgi:hypothetical protein
MVEWMEERRDFNEGAGVEGSSVEAKSASSYQMSADRISPFAHL